MRKEVLDGILNALEWAVSDVEDIVKTVRKGGDVDLRNVIIDSFQFISFIMDVEEQLNIEVPDELLVYDHLASLLGFAELMNTVKEETVEEEFEEEDFEVEEFEEEDFKVEDFEEENFEEEGSEEEVSEGETGLKVPDRTMHGPWSGVSR